MTSSDNLGQSDEIMRRLSLNKVSGFLESSETDGKAMSQCGSQRVSDDEASHPQLPFTFNFSTEQQLFQAKRNAEKKATTVSKAVQRIMLRDESI